MNLNPRFIALSVAATLAAGAATIALAATPSSGTISKASPRVEWTGSLTSSGTYYNAWDQDPTIECQAPACDTFNLKLADSDLLTINLRLQSQAAAGGNGGGGLRIKKPNGSYVWAKGESGPQKDFTVQIENAPVGNYVIDSVASYVCCGTSNYKANANLGALPGEEPTSTPPPTTTEPPPPSPPSTPLITTGSGNTAQPAATLGIKAGKFTARKLAKKRKLAVTVTASSPVTKVVATLKKGKTKIATGKLAKIEKSAKLTLKVAKKAKRKIKAGTYLLAVTAVDGQGNTVGAAVKLKVKR